MLFLCYNFIGDKMKDKRFITTLIISLVLVGCLLAYYFVRGGFNHIEPKLVDSYEIDYNEVVSVNLSLISTDITIKPTEEELIKVEYYSNYNKNPKIEMVDNVIRIDENEFNSACIGFCNIIRKVIVYVPSQYAGSFNLVTVSGDINSEIDMSNDHINITTVSGDAKLDIVNNINITTVSGDIKINSVQGKIDVVTTSGDIKINSVQGKIDVVTTSGDIKIGTLNIDTESEINTISGDIEIDNNECNCYIDFSTISGDNNIKKSDRKSDLVLKVKTTSGDISVN